MKYLDKDGLTHLWSKIKAKIPTKTSQLTNDSGYSTFSGSYNDLTNKPTIPTVNNATLTIQKNGTNVNTFTANASSNVTANITVPTKTSELTNDSGFLTQHQDLSNYVTLNGTQTISGLKYFNQFSNGLLNNTHIENSYYNTQPEGNGSILPFLYNDLAFYYTRGGTTTIYTTTDTDYTANSLTVTKTLTPSGKENMFDGSPSYCTSWGISATNEVVIIDMALPTNFAYSTYFYIDFGTGSWYARQCKLLLWNTDNPTNTYTLKKEWDETTSYHYVKTSYSYTKDGTTKQGFNRMRIVMTSFGTVNPRVAQIGLINYGSTGVRNTYMSRGIDDYLYRSITPNANNTYALGSSTKKWSNVYATTFNGNLTGNVTGGVTGNVTGYSTGLYPVCRVGSDSAGTSGWYKVATSTMSGWGNQNLLYYVKCGYSTGQAGILEAEFRSNNTSIECWRLNWATRHPSLAEDSIIVVISGMTWTMYAYNPSSQYGRVYFTEISYRGIGGQEKPYTITYSDNNTTKESAKPTATVTSADGWCVLRAKQDKNGNDITTTYYKASNPNGYTSNTGTITSVKMNGSTVSSSGEANLGTVLTSHQSIKTINNNTITGTGNVSVGTITGITMNGSSKGTSGVVDLGTVITDVSGKQDKITSTNKLDYSLLTNTPTIPTVNNATLTIQKNGTTVNTFTSNASSNVTANITVPTKTSDITNDSNFVTSSDLSTAIDNVWKTIYPVGSIYISVNSTNPKYTFGGSWVPFGTGKTLVGVNTNDTDFNTVEKTGGSKDLQKHSHDIRWSNVDGSGVTITTTGSGSQVLNISSFNWSNNTNEHSSAGANLFTNEVGTGTSGNLQPYITVYMWKRTA